VTPSPQDMPVVLTVEEAAKELRIGRSAAYAAVRRGELPVIRVGRILRVPRHRLEALLDGDVADVSREA
jgi:excisionase family DNA binding protein